MKVELLGEPCIGLSLQAETQEERDFLLRFWYNGIKVNGITIPGKELALTFLDLVDAVHGIRELTI